MQNHNSADTPQCWGKSELLKKLLQVGQMGHLAVVPRQHAKGKPGWRKFTDEEGEFNLWARAEYDPMGCWNFRGCLVGKYRQARYKLVGEQIASRVAWVLTRGPIPKSLCVLHTCDNESCVRPDHLFLGTRADNNLDKLMKNRQWHPRGELNHFSKLTESDVLKIHALRKTGLFQREIAEIIGTSRECVSHVLNITWSHLCPKKISE